MKEQENQVPGRVVWRRWLAVSIALCMVGVVMFIAGIWGDNRWGGTGAVFFIPGLLLLVAAAIQLSEQPRKRY